jgi:hypothetical protein
MHAHNIAWFTTIVFLATVMYRKIIGPTWVAGLAALMFVLDSNTYLPVMFVANRGFIIALCFGLLCFYAYHKWRTENSTPAALMSVLFLALSLLSNEAGVSTFAFILAYALVLDNASWPKRFLSLLPAILTVVIWRIVYHSLGYGVFGFGEGYLDPGHEPLKFLVHLPVYMIAIIAGQLSSLPPDRMMGFNNHWLMNIFLFYVVFTAAAILLLIPAVWKNRLVRFWFAVMIFAAIPVVAAPMSKNFGFVAIGAYGLIVVFAASIFGKQSGLPGFSLYKYPARILCIMLLIAHIPLAALSRYATPKFAPVILGILANPNGLSKIPLSDDSRVVIVNAPLQFSVCVMPFNAAYYGRAVPQSIHTLAFAYTVLEIKRIDDKTLVITSKETNIFTSAQSNVIHFSNFCALADRLFLSSRMFEKNRRFVLEGMTVEILELDDHHLPRKLAFTFDVPLEDNAFCWLQFNWKTFSYEPFNLPEPGEIVTTQGPSANSFHFCKEMRFLLGGR